MRVSLNEIDYVVKRAARGAGMAWGLAEEAGFSARWLAARRLPCLDVFAALFSAEDGAPYASLRPSAAWAAEGGLLCPIATGAALSDGLHRLSGLRLGALRFPLLLAPQLARAARDGAWSLSWEGASLLLQGGDAEVSGGPALAQPVADSVTLTRSSRPLQAPAREAGTGLPVDDALWGKLQAFAWRTYVPPSEESRAKGAGAGLTDND